jgi:ATP-dependent RNA helicase MSS116
LTTQLILDEADTLLDMGFTEDLNYIVDHTPKDRQTFLFSATVSPSIKKIARKYLDKDNLVIDCVPENESNVHEHIPQYATVVPSAKEQLPHVLKLLAADQLTNPGKSKSIVFLPTTKLTQLYATFIRELSQSLPAGEQTQVYEIHSKLEQRRRSKASDAFRQDDSGASVLVTSDVSARGVDYPGVTRVIQVGIPGTPEQYIHRVGRTGRGGSTGGQGDLVLLPWESKFLNALAEVPIRQVSTEETTAQLEQLAKVRDEAIGSGETVTSAVKKAVRRNDRFGTRGGLSDHSSEPYLPRYHKMDALIDELKVGLDAQAVEEVFVSMLGYYAAKADSLLKTPAMNIVQDLQTWAVEAGGLESPPYVSAAFLQKLGIRQNGRGGKKTGDRPFGERRGNFGRSEGNSFGGRDRNSGFSRDRDSGFSRDRDSGFSRDRDTGFSKSREGGFNSREGGFNRDRQGSFGRSSGPKFEPKKRGGFGMGSGQ